ncbi:hypothetical protein LINGRAHAP2_LOCUS23318 [Linum grandiflorum]
MDLFGLIAEMVNTLLLPVIVSTEPYLFKKNVNGVGLKCTMTAYGYCFGLFQYNQNYASFLWKIIHGILPTTDALRLRNMDVPSACPVCDFTDETISHLFVSCPAANQLALALGCGDFTREEVNPADFWRQLEQAEPIQTIKLIYFWWRVWKSRNVVVFENYQHSIDVLRRQFLHQWTEAMKSTQ